MIYYPDSVTFSLLVSNCRVDEVNSKLISKLKSEGSVHLTYWSVPGYSTVSIPHGHTA